VLVKKRSAGALRTSRRSLLWLPAILVFVVMVGVNVLTLAQVGNARIRGIVADPQGGVIPNAKVSLTNEQTGVKATTRSDGQGQYAFPEVPLGKYDLQVDAPGFKVFQHLGLVVTADQQLTLNAPMAVGTASETVSVSGEGSLVDTQTGTIKNIIDQQSIQDLPLESRDVRQLVALTQGVIAVAPTFNSNVQSSTLPGTPDFTFNGGRENTVNYLLDGVDNNDPYTNVPAPYPDPDALAQFSVQTSNFDAEYGRNSGGIVDAITRSGTNKVHGSAYEFLRDSTFGLDANDWYTNHTAPGSPEPFLLQHQFGGSVGGPVFIPHLYDGRNKSFWFVADQQTIIHTAGAEASETIPTPAQRGAISANGCNGADLSYFLPSNLGNHPGDSRSFIVTNPTTGAPFSNNCIPTSMLNSAATQFLNTYVPSAPNSIDPSNPNAYNFPSAPSDTDQNQLTVRGDQKLSGANQLTLRYYRFSYSSGEAAAIPNNIAYGTAGFVGSVDNATIQLTTVFSPHLVNLAYLGYSHIFSFPGEPPPGYPTSHSLGLNVFSIAPNPLDFGITGWTGAGGTGAGSLPNDRNSFPLGDTLNYQAGNHSLKFGAQIERVQQYYDYNAAYPNFSFNGTFSGNGLSDFLLGDFYQLTEASPEILNTRFTSWATFAQDNWKLNKRLSLDLSLRWEPWLPPHFVGPFNPVSLISSSAFAAGQISAVYPNAPPGLLFLGDKGVPRGGTNADYRNFSPRVGFAYDLAGDQKLVVRGAYGVFYDQPKNDLYNHFLNGEPFNFSELLTNTSQGLLNWQNPYNGQPDPVGTFVDKGTNIGPSATFTTDLAGELSFENFHMPYIQQWNLTVERQLPWNSVGRITYVGSKGTHLEWTRDANTPINGTGPISTWLNPELRRPMAPYFGYVNGLYWDGWSNYNGLQLSFEHRFSHGLSTLINYERSRAMDSNSDSMEFIAHGIQNPYNLPGEYGPAEYDVPNNLVASFAYVLPIPSTHNRALDEVVRGWQLNGIVSVHSETPYSIFITEDNMLNTENYQRAQLTGVNPHLPDPSRIAWYNTAAYTDQYTALTATDISGRDSGIRGPAYSNLDMSAFKNVTIKGLATQFRVQAFNAINNPSLGIDVGSQYPSSPVFGQLSTYKGGRIVEFGIHTAF
jgi:Carboxypeptidase regulatory-like domain/TonB-dependent Receptor Plug Domain